MRLNRLDKEAIRILDRMDEVEPNTPAYEKLLNELQTLCELINAQEALNIDDRKNERDNRTKKIIEIASLGVGTATIVWFMYGSWDLESKGYDYVSSASRWFVNKIKLKLFR